MRIERPANTEIVEPVSVYRKQRRAYQRLKRTDEPLFAILSEDEVLNFVRILQRKETSVATRRDAVLYHQCETQCVETMDELLTGENASELSVWRRGTVLRWCARADGYPNAKCAVVAAAQLWCALEDWSEALRGRVEFEYTDLVDAHFVLQFDRCTQYVRAFTPSEAGNTLNFVRVGTTALKCDARVLKGLFQHHVGHMLGAMHRVPPQCMHGLSDERCCVVWGSMGEFDSVMDCRLGLTLKKSDVRALRLALDGLADGENVTGGGMLKSVKRRVRIVRPVD